VTPWELLARTERSSRWAPLISRNNASYMERRAQGERRRERIPAQEEQGKFIKLSGTLRWPPRKALLRFGEDHRGSPKGAPGSSCEHRCGIRALYVLALLCGLREGELLRLRWDDVDLNGNTATLQTRRTLSETRTGPQIQDAEERQGPLREVLSEGHRSPQGPPHPSE
jgi:integrase